MSRILVIKLGALGDFVQALGPMAAIRRHHPAASITLLTTPPFEALAAASGYVDAVLLDRRPRWHDLEGLTRLRRVLRDGRFTRVYDLQTSDRSGWYFRLIGARPEWSGIARGASHRHTHPGRDLMHTIDRQRDQLATAGIGDVAPPDLSWAAADITGFDLPAHYALLVAGGAAHRPRKRWPARRFASLARHLGRDGIQPVLIGGPGETALAAEILGEAPDALDLTGRTDLLQLASVGRKARAAIGNDTGPMHLLAAAGVPSIVLFSAESDPALTAPRGPQVTILRRENLADLSVHEVAGRLAKD